MAITELNLTGKAATDLLAGKEAILAKSGIAKGAAIKGVEIEVVKAAAGKAAVGKTVAGKTGAVVAAGQTATAGGSAVAKAAGHTIWSGKGFSLGLGLGLGAWGPMILLGLGAAAIYGYYNHKDDNLETAAE